MTQQKGAHDSSEWWLQNGVRELLTDKAELTRVEVVDRLCRLLGATLHDPEFFRQQTLTASGFSGDLQRTALVGSLSGEAAVTASFADTLREARLVAATTPLIAAVVEAPSLTVVSDVAAREAA